jgi:hypothetical protein
MTNRLILFSVFSGDHTKTVNIPCGDNAVFLILKQVVHICWLHCCVKGLKYAYLYSVVLSMTLSDMEIKFILGLK